MDNNEKITWIHEPISDENLFTILNAYADMQKAIDNELEIPQTTSSQEIVSDETKETIYKANADVQKVLDELKKSQATGPQCYEDSINEEDIGSIFSCESLTNENDVDKLLSQIGCVKMDKLSEQTTRANAISRAIILEIENKKLKNDKELLTIQLEETENDRDRIQKHCTAVENELSSLKLEHKSLVETNEQLLTVIEINADELKCMKSENKRLENEINEIKENNIAALRKDEKPDQVQGLKLNNDNLDKDIEKTEGTIDTVAVHSGITIDPNNLDWIHESVSNETLELIAKAYAVIQKAIHNETSQTACSQKNEALPDALFIADSDAKMGTEGSTSVDDIIDLTLDDDDIIDLTLDDDDDELNYTYKRIITIEGEIKLVKCYEEKDRERRAALIVRTWNPFSGANPGNSTEEDALKEEQRVRCVQGGTGTENRNGNGKRPLDEDEPTCSNKRNRL